MAKKDDAMQGLCLPRATCGRAHNSHNLQHSTFNAALTIKIIIIIFKLICKLPNRARTELNLTQKERERESEREWDPHSRPLGQLFTAASAAASWQFPRSTNYRKCQTLTAKTTEAATTTTKATGTAATTTTRMTENLCAGIFVVLLSSLTFHIN